MEIEGKMVLLIVFLLPVILVSSTFSSLYNTTDAVVRVEHLGELVSDDLYYLLKEYNRSKLFNYSQQEFYDIVDLFSDKQQEEVLRGLTKWTGKNIEYEMIIEQQLTYHKNNNPALVVLEGKKAVCLGMSILLANLIMAYNDSIPTYICFGVIEDMYRNSGHASVICYVNGSYVFLDPVNYRLIGFPVSKSIDFFEDEPEIFDMCCLVSKDGAYNLKR